MSSITLFPYEGIDIGGQHISFGMHWEEIQKRLSLPDHRFLDYDPNDVDEILTEDGEYRNDYKDTTPGKLDFKEERGTLEFIYENGRLHKIEVLRGCRIQAEGYMFAHNGLEDYLFSMTVHETEMFEETQTYVVKDLGVVSHSLKGLGYVLCSAKAFEDYMKFERIYIECKKRFDRK